MEINNGRLGFSQTLDNEQFKQALNQSRQKVDEFSSKSVASMNAIDVKMGDLVKGALAFAGIDFGANLIKDIVKVRGEFEQLEIAFSTMLGSKERADILMKDIVTFAATTPFGLQSTSEATKMLLAYGEHADTALDTMRKLGDIASGVGISLKDIAYLYGTTMTQGRMYTQDLNQFLGRGIPMLDELAKVFGVSKNEVKALVEEGKVGFPELQRVIDNLTASGSMFGGLMEAQSKSIAGQIEQLKDAVDVMFNNLGKEAQPAVSALINGTAKLVENYDKILNVIKGLVVAYGTYRTALMIATVAQSANTMAVTLASKAWQVLNATVMKNPYSIMLSVIIGLTASLLDLSDILGEANVELAGMSAEMEVNATYTKELAKSVADTKSKIDPLIAVIKDETASLNVRKRAYQDLIKQHPEFIGTLDNEYRATKQLDLAYQGLIKRLDEAALARARESVRQQRAQRLADAEAQEYDAKLRADAEIEANKKIEASNKKLAENYANTLKTTTRESADLSYAPKNLNTVAKKAYDEAKENVAAAKKEMDDFSEYSKQWYKEQDVQQENTQGLGIKTDAKKAKTKKTSTKKADDPVEEFKKQVNDIKQQYADYNKWLDTNDTSLITHANALGVTLKQKGESYIEFLRNQQAELIKSADTSATARKQLYFINQELQQLISHSEIEQYKKGIEQQINNATSLLQVTDLLQKAKNELAGKGDQASLDKMEFLNEKDIDNVEKLSQVMKNIVENNRSELQEMNALFQEYINDIEILNIGLTKAFEEQDQERIQSFQTAIEERTKKFGQATKGMTGDADYSELLRNYQTYSVRREEIEKDFEKKIQVARKHNNEELAQSLLEKQKEALQSLDSEMLRKSKNWIKYFEDFSRKSSTAITSLIQDLESDLSNPVFLEGKSVEDVNALEDKLKELRDFLVKNNPFEAISISFKKMLEDFKAGKKIDFENIRFALDAINNSTNEVFVAAENLGISISESNKSAIQLGTDLLQAGSNIAQGISNTNPLQVVKGIVQGITSIINAGDRKKERQIQNYKKAVDELNKSFQQLEYSASKALGGDSYAMQKQMMDNLIKQQAEYQKMINAERSKKKSDKGKIAEWEQALLDAKQKIQEIMESLVQDVLQTNAKDLASTLGDALVSAFAQGEDAAKSFEKVVNDVMKNAVLNQLKQQFLEKPLQKALDQLYKDMGGDGNGNFHWNGLSAEEQEEFRRRMKEISENFNGMLAGYSDLFKDFEIDPNENALSGAIKGVSEETASLLAGQMNAIRILQVEAVQIHRNSNQVLIRQLDALHKIDYNTRFIEQIYNYLRNDNTRAYGY